MGTMQGEEMKSEVTKILEEKLTTDEDAGQRLIEISKHEDKSNNQEMDQPLLAEKVEVEYDDGKCETSNLDKGETNGTINVNDSNDSEREASNKMSEAKEGNTRPEEVNEKGEELKREEQEEETGSQFRSILRRG